MPHHNVYVVELSEDVWKHRPFRERNPERRVDKPCLYVGLTGKTPEARFAQHKAGIRAAKYVKRYGVRLRPRMYQRHNPMTYKEAVEFEKELARRLRKRRFGVWQA